MSGNIKPWHSLYDTACPQNTGHIELDCTCKRVVKRAPYRRVRVTDETVDHGIRPRLEVRLWPNGVLQLREVGRRTLYSTTTAQVYKQLVVSAILSAKRAKRAERRASRKRAK